MNLVDPLSGVRAKIVEQVTVQDELFASKVGEVSNHDDSSVFKLWSKYSLGRVQVISDSGESEDKDIDDVTHLCGLSRKVVIKTALVAAMDARPFNAIAFADGLRAVDTDTLAGECMQEIKIATAVYKLKVAKEGGEEGKGEETSSTTCGGSKTVTSILHHAVDTGNAEAVRELMKAGVDAWTSKKLNFNLKSTTYQQVMLLELPKLNKPANKSAQTTANSKAALKGVPEWKDSDFEWTENTDALYRDPFCNAFYLQNTGVVSAFLEFEAITAMSGQLSLGTNMRPWPQNAGNWPQGFSSLQNLTWLKLQCPNHKGPVPPVIFTLKALTHLVLVGSGYTVIPDEIVNLSQLQVLSVADMKLSKLPVVKMSVMRQLTAVDCTNVKLASPPPEIVKQGPEAVARYILDLEAGADENTDVLLMFIGDGEAGKTSTLLALKNTETNTARPIGVDDRTIGIDISEFKPFPEAPLRFSAWDFGGQAVYAIMQQLFMSRRALYPLLWRVRESLDISRFDPMIKCDVCKKVLVAPRGHQHLQQPVYRVKGQGLCHAGCVSYESMITSWTERLQFRVPGVTVVLIATHIDCASEEQANAQCTAVAEVAQRIVARQAALEGGIAQLRIHNNGESLRVNNVSGDGVQHLRDQLCAIAEGLDFYGEVIPASYARLRKRLREMQRRGEALWRTWMTWEDYKVLGAECGIDTDEALSVATKFFHETGELRYFGEATREVNKAAKERGQSQNREAHELLAATVFPNPFWIVDVLRGLIRHDHAAVLQLIEDDATLSAKNAKVMRRRVHRLMQRGLLHKSLLPFIWHNIAGMSTDEATNEDEYRRLIALLQAFDILMVKPGDESGCDWIVPSLSAGKHARTIDAKAFEDDSLPFTCRLVYDALPPFFDMMLVAHVMNSGIAQSVDFIEGAAAFRKYGDKALLFAGLGKVRNPRTVFRQDQLNEELMRKVLREDQCHVVITASSRLLLSQLLKEVSVLEEFFPGLRRLAALFPCATCRKFKQQRLEQLRAESSSTADVDHEQELQDAELFDLEEQKYLADVAGKADDPACDRQYYACTGPLTNAWQTLEPRLADLVPWGGWYIKGGYLNTPYNNGRMWGTPRYYEETLMLMREVRAVVAPTAQEQEVYQRETDALNQPVNDRKFFIGTQQAGAELPSMRTVAKYCDKNIDTLALAWCVNTQMSELFGSLASFHAEGLGGRVAAEDLKREDAVPELIYFLKSVTDLLASHTQCFFECDAQIDEEANEQYIKESKLKVELLSAAFPELAMDRSDANHYLAQAYGASTTDRYRFHHLLLTKATSLLDAQTVSLEIQENIRVLGTQNEANTANLLADWPALEAAEATNLCFIDWLHRNEPSWDAVRRNIREQMMQVDGDAQVRDKRCSEELRYLDFKSDLAVREAVRSSTAELLIQLRTETVGTAPEESNQVGCGWVQRALQSCERGHMTLLLPVATLSASSKLANQWKQVFNASPVADTEVRAGCEHYAEAAERLNALTRLFQCFESVIQADDALRNQYATLQSQLADCDAAEASLWNITPKELHESPCGDFPQFAQKNIADLDAIFAAIPELRTSCDVRYGGQPDGLVPAAYQQTPADGLFSLAPDSQPHSAAHRFLARVLNIMRTVNMGDNSAAEVLEQKKATLETEFSRFPVDVNRDGYQQYIEFSAKEPRVDTITNELFSSNGSELATKFLAWWSSVQSQAESLRYQEVIYIISLVMEGMDRSEVLATFERRSADMKEVDSYVTSTRATRVKAAQGDVAELASLTTAAMKQRRECTDACLAFQALLVEKAAGPVNALLAQLEQRQDSVIGAWRAAAQEVVHVFRERLRVYTACADSTKLELTAKLESIKGPLEQLIEDSKHTAAVAKDKRLQLITDLQAGEVGQALTRLVEDTNCALTIYIDARSNEKNAKNRRLSALVDFFTKRTDKYARLMELRRDYGPVWYFGGGERMYSNREAQKWSSDWERFIDVSNNGPVCMPCPAEYPGVFHPCSGYRQDNAYFDNAVAQPADPCVIYISHMSGDHGSRVAELIASSIAKEGIAVRCKYSCLLFNEQDRLAAIAQCKVFICCLDADYTQDAERSAEYALAASLEVEVIPVLIAGFSFSSYQCWWPPEMTFLEKHSLFVDLRRINTENEDHAHSMCKASLVATVRQLLRDWVPKTVVQESAATSHAAMLRRQQSVQYEATAAVADSEGTPVDTQAVPAVEPGEVTHLATADAPVGFGSKFILCEECALEGNRRSHFDRHACQKLLESWKAEELVRRSSNTLDAAVAVCPLKVQCSEDAQHEMRVVDVLAAKLQEMTIPCPRCLSRGILPPFCFQREVCLTELEFNRGGSLLCRRCTDTVPLFELLRSEVFISYNWGAPVCPKCSTSYWKAPELSSATGLCPQCEVRFPKEQSKCLTQMLVSEMKQRIEEEAGVTCWQDLDRLVGGKDLVKEMEAGIQCCEVVVIFLSDAYVKSVNCMKEYLFTTKHGKFIIPVLLRDYKAAQLLVPASGVPATEDTAPADETVWWDESMSSLSQFKPILLMDESQLENVLFEISERIQSRFHRAQRYATAADAVDFLRDYEQWGQTRRAFVSDHATTLARPEVEEYLRKLFREIDLDADGFLSEDELATFLDNNLDNSVFSREQIAALIAEADVDCDGLLTVEEFKTAVITVLEDERQRGQVA